MHERSCGIIPIRFEKGKASFLLIQHHAGHWGFPKGHTEEGESEIETARRELFEETGIKIKRLYPKRYLERYQYHRDGTNRKKTVVYFVATVKPGRVKIQKKEIMDYAWLSYRSVFQRIRYTEMRRILEEMKKDILKPKPIKRPAE